MPEFNIDTTQINDNTKNAGSTFTVSFFISLLFLFVTLKVFAGNDRPELNVKYIPEELKKDANAIIRYDETVYDIIDINSYTVSTTREITILGKGAEDYTFLYEFYDNWSTLKNFEVMIYDASGNFLQKVKAKEIIDQSAVSSGLLYTDSRVKYTRVLNNNYPFTIVFSTEKKVSNFVDFSSWIPQEGEDIAIQKAILKISFTDGYRLGTKTFSVNEPEVSISDGRRTLTYFIKDVHAYKDEQFSAPYFEQTPTVMFKPEDFIIDGLTGSNNSWNEYGAFFYELNKDLDSISAEGTAEIYEQIANISDTKEKVRVLYKYMQKKTRYVAVELGIGGYKSYPASYVEEYGYGDCKALSNYMKSILSVAGINSYLTVVEAGNDHIGVLEEFPSSQFNHMILCVPIEKDTIWLECTSPFMPFGFLGDFTDNRLVLLLSEEGGKLVKTKEYSAEDNYQNTFARVTFDKDFNALCKAKIDYGSLQYDNIFFLKHLDADTQKKRLYNYIKIKEFVLKDYSFTETGDEFPNMEMKLDLELKRYISKTGSRVFLPMNLMNKSSFVPNKLDERKNDIYIRHSYTDRDTICYEIPSDYLVEFLPDPIDISSTFGSYHSECQEKDGSVIFIRQMQLLSGRFPKDKYQELYNFYKEVNKADNQKTILGWNTSAAE